MQSYVTLLLIFIKSYSAQLPNFHPLILTGATRQIWGAKELCFCAYFEAHSLAVPGKMDKQKPGKNPAKSRHEYILWGVPWVCLT